MSFWDSRHCAKAFEEIQKNNSFNSGMIKVGLGWDEGQEPLHKAARYSFIILVRNTVAETMMIEVGIMRVDAMMAGEIGVTAAMATEEKIGTVTKGSHRTINNSKCQIT